MKKILLASFLFGSCYCVSAQVKSVKNTVIPSLEEVSGIWWNADTIMMEPSLRNFKGQALLNRDMTSVSWIASAPYSGGYHTGVMRINGETPRAQLFRWYPWQSLRKADMPTYHIESNVRMLPDTDLFMWKITITNNTKTVQQYKIEQDLIGFMSRYQDDAWPWSYPYPTMQGKMTVRTNEIVNVRWNIGRTPAQFENITADSALTPRVNSWPSDLDILNTSKYHVVSQSGNSIIIADNETQCFSAFGLIDKPEDIVAKNSGGTAYWSCSLKPGETKTIRYIFTYADTKENAAAGLSRWDKNFESNFTGIEANWKLKWKKIFEPGNDFISGCFPTLETGDTAVRRVYYAGPLTMLYLMNTNLPTHKRVHLTGGPIWGGCAVFFWDTAEWSTLLSMVDPAMLKEQIRSWVTLDIRKYYGKDNYTGKGMGNGYVANYWAVFQLIRSYITVTGDYEFLKEPINGKRLIDYLSDYSYNWKNVSIYGKPGCTDDMYKLADFGDDPWNLLECVPTYIHIVPSFNAGYVWMLRETAKFFTMIGEPAKATAMNSDAEAMAARVLKLYAGNGVWYSLYPDNKKVEVRHVLDFIYFGRYMPADLSGSMKSDMMSFVNDELLTDTWMRAQSLKDVAAAYSDRPDHGPLGAYDGWPAATMDAFAQMGYTKQALHFYKSILPVTNEGEWSQAHELWGDNKLNKNARVRIPMRGWTCRDAAAGIELSQVVIKDFFGFYPAIEGQALQPSAEPLQLNATLHNVLYMGKYYELRYNNGKTTMELIKRK